MYLYFGYPVCFYFCWNSIDSSTSSWTKRWMLVLEMSATFWRQHGNEAVEVSFESRTARMSALFHIFMCTFLSSVISLIILLTLPSPSSAVLPKVPNVAAAVLPIKHSNDQNKASPFNLWPVVGRKIWRTWQLISCWDQKQASPFNLWPVVSSTEWRTWQLTHYWNLWFSQHDLSILFMESGENLSQQTLAYLLLARIANTGQTNKPGDMLGCFL